VLLKNLMFPILKPTHVSHGGLANIISGLSKLRNLRIQDFLLRFIFMKSFVFELSVAMPIVITLYLWLSSPKVMLVSESNNAHIIFLLFMLPFILFYLF